MIITEQMLAAGGEAIMLAPEGSSYVDLAHVCLVAALAVSPPSDRATIIEECAKIIDAEAERILSKQTPTTDPLSMTDTINHNLRMMACILPELSASVRALPRPSPPVSGMIEEGK